MKRSAAQQNNRARNWEPLTQKSLAAKLLRCCATALILLFTVNFLLSAKAYALNVERRVLDNGLVVLHSESRNLPLVMVTMIVKASPLDEPKEKAGLAHLVSELLDEGTKTRESVQISDEIEFIGASIGLSTESDYIKISLSVLKKDVEKGFDLFSDILLNPIFLQEELERKKELIIGALRQKEEDPSFLAERAFKKEVFGEHAYGRLIEGSAETISNISREDLIEFHARYFVPNNAILSVVGDISFDELSSLIRKFFNNWKPGKLFERKPVQPKEDKKKKVIKIEKDTTQASIIMGHLGISRNNPDYYAVSVMNYILGGGGFSSRLMQKIRDDMGLAYDVHSFFSASKEKGAFQAGVQTKNEMAHTAINEMLKQIEKIRTEEVSDSELLDAKAYLTGSFPRRLDTNRKVADFLANVEFYSLGLDYAEKYPSYINAITKKDILEAAKKYLDADNYVLVIVGNQKKINNP